jgi:hypothetical protein
MRKSELRAEQRPHRRTEREKNRKLSAVVIGRDVDVDVD